MKVLRLLLFISLASLIVSFVGYNDFMTKSYNQPVNLQYHHEINRANRALYDSDWSLADHLFAEAFKLIESPYYIDLKNAIITLHKMKDFPKRDSLLNYTIHTKRLSLPVFVHEFPFLSKQSQVANFRLAIAVNDSIGVVQKEWIQLLNDLYVLNQTALGKKIAKEIDKVSYQKFTDSLSNRFIDAVENWGFPDEKNCGAFITPELTLADRILSLSFSFIHTKYRDKLLAIYQQAMLVGELHPSIYASIMTRTDADFKEELLVVNYMNTPVVEITGSSDPYIPFVLYSDSLMKKVNASRLNIGLDSLHIVQEQIVCCRYCPQVNPKRMIAIAPYARIDRLPGGFVRQAADEVAVDLNDYLLNVDWITKDCNCKEKQY